MQENQHKQLVAEIYKLASEYIYVIDNSLEYLNYKI